MTTIPDDNIFGFFASFTMDDKDQEVIKSYLWGEEGLTNKLSSLKWHPYGQDFHLILFEFYLRPIPFLRDNLREIENYRRKEKSIGIPIIVDDENFLKLNEIGRQTFLKDIILTKLDLLKDKVKRNKFDLDIQKLRADVEKVLNNNLKAADTSR